MTEGLKTEQKLSPAFVVGLLGVLIVLWAFATRVGSPASKDTGASAAAPNPEESALHAVGLPYNADWVGLPTYFKAVANRASWDGNQTFVAYWNPGSNSYGYFFKVVRSEAGFRFEEVMPAEALEPRTRKKTLAFLQPEPAEDDKSSSREERFPDHPFVFLPLRDLTGGERRPVVIERPQDEPGQRSPIPVELDPSRPSLPTVERPQLKREESP